MSEMDCLTVNIYTPPDLGDERKVPVFAYIHGGAFAHGDSGTEQGWLFHAKLLMNIVS